MFCIVFYSNKSFFVSVLKATKLKELTQNPEMFGGGTNEYTLAMGTKSNNKSVSQNLISIETVKPISKNDSY